MQSFDSQSNQKTEQRTVFPRPATPWMLDGMPWQLATTNAPQPGGVMQFGSQDNADINLMNTISESRQFQYGRWHPKRRSLEQNDSMLPPKQLITEDRITMHFSGLQIGDSKGGLGAASSAVNNNGLTSALASDDIPSTSTGKTHHHPNPAYQIAALELEQKLRNANRIVLCDELKTAGAMVDAIPAELLLKSIPRPCTALVPWEPPLAKVFGEPDRLQSQQQLQGQQQGSAAVDLDDYDDGLGFFENNNTCNVNLNKADEQMDEDLDL